jgi:hypothetical protein
VNRTPEQAAKNGEKFYTINVKNGDEDKEINLPLFIYRKQNGSPAVDSDYKRPRPLKRQFACLTAMRNTSPTTK